MVAGSRYDRNLRLERKPTHRGHGYFRQSLRRLSRLLDKRQSRAVSRHPLSTTLSDSNFSLEKLADAQTATTVYSDEMLDMSDSTNELQRQSDQVLSKDNLLRLVNAKLAQSSFAKSRIDCVDVKFTNGQQVTWRRPRDLFDLPKNVRERIWREVVVSDDKFLVCACWSCRAERLVATQPPLTRVCRSIRAEALPIFYQQNYFNYPIGHARREHTLRAWLNSIGPENRGLLRHLQLAFWNAERAITSLVLQGEFVFTKEYIADGEIVWDADNVMRRSEWCVLTAAPDTSIEDEVESVGTSILFEEGVFLDDIVEEELEFEPEKKEEEEGSWKSGQSGSSSCSEGEEDRLPLLAPTTPPKVLLTRGNGEEFGDPRWSFAAKFQDHIARRLASLSCEPRTPPTTRTPRVVLAPDEDEAEESESEAENTVIDAKEADTNSTVGATKGVQKREETLESWERRRYSSASWVVRR